MSYLERTAPPKIMLVNDMKKLTDKKIAKAYHNTFLISVDFSCVKTIDGHRTGAGYRCLVDCVGHIVDIGIRQGGLTLFKNSTHLIGVVGLIFYQFLLFYSL